MRKNQTAEVRKPEILENYYQILIQEGFEGASIGKVAQRMGIHPSLIIHYFKTKANMTSELVELMIEKYMAPEMLQFHQIADPEQRLQAMVDIIFSFEWSRTLDPGLHFGFYYLSFRNPTIHKRYKEMIRGFRDYIVKELEQFRQAGVVRSPDLEKAADIIVTLMEGMEFHAHFLADDKPFKEFADYAKKVVFTMLRNDRMPDETI